MERQFKVIKISCIAEYLDKNMNACISLWSIVTSIYPLLFILVQIFVIADLWWFGSGAKETYKDSCNQVLLCGAPVFHLLICQTSKKFWVQNFCWLYVLKTRLLLWFFTLKYSKEGHNFNVIEFISIIFHSQCLLSSI